ncbi:hypothetical protein HKX48_004278 [Thoreauomyces humboldtii]|nr:hypothetical protein HKX48_004278 [Thoreauomyces humboldtii]
MPFFRSSSVSTVVSNHKGGPSSASGDKTISAGLRRESTAVNVVSSLPEAAELTTVEQTPHVEPMPDRHVVDGWFDEIMSTLPAPIPQLQIISASGARMPARTPAPRSTSLTTEAKWELVRVYKAKQDLAIKEERDGPKQCIRMDPEPVEGRPCARFLSEVVRTGSQRDTLYRGAILLEKVRELRVCVSSELVSWSVKFLDCNGMRNLSMLLQTIAEKPERSAEDWALHFELLRTLRGLLRQPEAFPYLFENPRILTYTSQTLFGWWRSHHHHPDHYTRCIGFNDQDGGISLPTPPSTQTCHKTGRFQEASECQEPPAHESSYNRPSLAARTVGCEIFALAIRGGAWDLVLRSLAAVATAPTTASTTKSMPASRMPQLPEPAKVSVVPNTLRPWTMTLLRVVLQASGRWSGLPERAGSVYDALCAVAPRTMLFGHAATVPAPPLVPDNPPEAEVKDFLVANVGMIESLLTYAPDEERAWVASILFEKAGMNAIMDKLRQSPYPALSGRIDTLAASGLYLGFALDVAPRPDASSVASSSLRVHPRRTPSQRARHASRLAATSSVATADRPRPPASTTAVAPPPPASHEAASASIETVTAAVSSSPSLPDAESAVSEENWDFAGDGSSFQPERMTNIVS